MKDAKGHGSNPRGALGFWSHESAPVASGVAHVASIARAHGIAGGPFKVQSLNTKLLGRPWQTDKAYRNRAVAERVAQHMRTDGGYTRVRMR